MAIVTGASRGIGRAIAKRLAADGALVIAAARGTNAQAVVDEIIADGHRATAQALDITDTASVDAAALSAIRGQVPAALLEQAVEYAPKLKLPGLRYLRNNEPETYRVLAQAITAKPAKPSVSIEPIELRAAA